MNLREWALPVYTILAQMGTGALFTLWLIRAFNAPKIGNAEMDRMVVRPVAAIWLTILVAILGSHMHLSVPLLSFLALRNVDSSWLSREVLFTTMLFFCLTALAAVEWQCTGRTAAKTALGWAGVTFGTLGIFCMAEIYLLPAQPAWNTPLTTASFYATALQLGIMEVAVLLVMDLKFTEMREPEAQSGRREVVRRAFVWLAAGTALMTMVVVLLNYAQIARLQDGSELAHLSLDLLLGLYRPLFIIRIGLTLAGAALLLLTVASMRRGKKAIADLMMPTYISCLMVLVGEILGRFLFYATHIRVGI